MYQAVLVVTLIATATACSGGGPAATVTTERDSAGVMIVDNTVDTAALRGGWSIASVPTLVVGGLSAPDEDQLFQIRGGTVLPDGRIVIMNAGSSELRVYGADGVIQQMHGRKGEGPGEFSNASLAGRTQHDTLVVFDQDLRRISIMDADQGFVRSYGVGDDGGGYPLAIGVTPTGELAVGGGMYFSSTDGFQSGPMRPNSRYGILAQDGSVQTDYGDIPAADMFARVGDGGASLSLTSIPFARRTAATVTPSRFWLGTADNWDIRVFDFNGTLTRIVRFDRPAQPVTGAMRDAALQEEIDEGDGSTDEPAIRRLFGDMPIPETVPPYQRLEIDSQGNVWIGEYVLPGQIDRTYTIVNHNGHAIGRVTFPERTSPLEIGNDYILAVTRDELEVESLTLWPLTRGP